MNSSRIFALATAVPDHVCTQEQSIRIARQAFHDAPEAAAFVERLVRASGIERRHTVLSDYECEPNERTFFARTADFRPEPTTRERNDVFNREAPLLAAQACERLPSGWSSGITHLLTASCTGFGAPGFDVALARRLRLSPHVHRIHVGFMGCYAGFTTLKVADAICRADPSALVLIVHVELCSLHVHFSPAPDALIADSLFADGASAALVGGEWHAYLARTAAPLEIISAGALLLPGGEEEMQWSVGNHGFDMVLSPRVPHLLHKHLPSAIADLLGPLGVSRDQVRHWAIHPGGPAILDQAKKALALDEPAVAMARDVLAQHGNMSSVTLWFLLDQISRSPHSGLVCACGFGPGLNVESALLSHPGAV